MRGILLIPVDHQKVKGHAYDTVNNLNAVKNFLNGIVKLEVPDFNIFLLFVFVFINSFKIAVVKHSHWTMAVGVPTISIKFVNRILQPSIALLLKDIFVHEYVIEHNDYLEKLKCI